MHDGWFYEAGFTASWTNANISRSDFGGGFESREKLTAEDAEVTEILGLCLLLLGVLCDLCG